MKISTAQDVERMPVTMPGAEKASMRVLMGKRDGAKNFVMRLFEVEKGGFTPYHQHNYEHEIYVLEGKGVLTTDKGPKEFAAGSFMFIAADEMHQFKNIGNSTLKFLCLIPAENSQY